MNEDSGAGRGAEGWGGRVRRGGGEKTRRGK